jgi:hypothetical protein
VRRETKRGALLLGRRRRDTCQWVILTGLGEGQHISDIARSGIARGQRRESKARLDGL